MKAHLGGLEVPFVIKISPNTPTDADGHIHYTVDFSKLDEVKELVQAAKNLLEARDSSEDVTGAERALVAALRPFGAPTN